MSRSTYIFLDESGNLDFSASGTRYFVLTCISTRRPFAWGNSLDEYKYDCIEYGEETSISTAPQITGIYAAEFSTS